MSKSQVDTNDAEQLDAEAVESVETEKPEEVAEAPEKESAPTEEVKGDDAQANVKSLDDLDGESLRKIVRDLRRESGSYRTQLQKVRELQSEMEKEVTTLKTDLSKREKELVRHKVGEGLPAELRDRIKGDTEEEMKADAAELARLFTPSHTGFGTNPSGGLDTGKAPDVSVEDALAAARRQRR